MSELHTRARTGIGATVPHEAPARRLWPALGRAGQFADLSGGDYQYRARRAGHPVQRFWHQQKWPLVAHLLAPRQGDRLLDVGAGSSETTLRASECGAFAYGVDPFLAPLRFLGRLVQRGEPPRPGYANGDVHALPFRDDSFDRIAMLEVIEHLPAEGIARYLAELRRVLVSGGRLFVTTPNYRSYWPALEWFVDRFMVSAQLGGDEHITHFSAARLRGALEGAGFRVLRLGSVYHLSPFLAPFSRRLARRCFAYERDRGGRLGPILYALAEPADGSSAPAR